jgi:predicted dithiol-disulfide oxidoreductase (DUF899 family)
VKIEKEYRFATEDGQKTLPELFDGRSQLFVYHFMFGPKYQAGCPVCSSGADTYNGAIPHLNARDVTLSLISRAPLDRLLAFRERMGWSIPWASSEGSDFNFDFQASQPDEQAAAMAEAGVPPAVELGAKQSGTDAAGYLTEAPAVSVFALDDGDVYQTYSTGARGLEIMLGFYPLLDRVPKGRDEEKDSEFWIRHHDQY